VNISGPLAGSVVADFSRVLAGPDPTMLLGALGAVSGLMSLTGPDASSPSKTGIATGVRQVG
jgi:crotonobetainyl-CoA:carnitine CoA-transferase CaiB-like acyl-CoA transferase